MVTNTSARVKNKTTINQSKVMDTKPRDVIASHRRRKIVGCTVPGTTHVYSYPPVLINKSSSFYVLRSHDGASIISQDWAPPPHDPNRKRACALKFLRILTARY